MSQSVFSPSAPLSAAGLGPRGRRPRVSRTTMTMASAMVAAAPTPKTAAISAAQSAKKGSGTIWMSMSSALRIHKSLVKKIS